MDTVMSFVDQIGHHFAPGSRQQAAIRDAIRLSGETASAVLHAVIPGVLLKGWDSLTDAFSLNYKQWVWRFESRGEMLTARPLEVTDKDRLVDAFEKLSARSRFNRYLTSVQHLSGSRLENLLDTGNPLNVSLVVTAERDGDPEAESVAVVRYYRYAEDSEEAELAITLSDSWQGFGLGKSLVLLLMQTAASNGIKRLVADVHVDNIPMKYLLRSMGARQQEVDAGVVHYILPVPELPAVAEAKLRKRVRNLYKKPYRAPKPGSVSAIAA